MFLGYEPYRGDMTAIPHGSIVATEAGVSNNYGLVTAQGRGKLFISAGVAVYEGMVVGENAKEGDVLVQRRTRKTADELPREERRPRRPARSSDNVCRSKMRSIISPTMSSLKSRR